MVREIERVTSNHDTSPVAPSPSTLPGLLRGMISSPLWRSLIPDTISIDSMKILFEKCLLDSSHVLQTCAVELLVKFELQLHDFCSYVIETYVFSSKYIELHPTIIPMLAEELLKHGHRNLLLLHSAAFTRFIWMFATSQNPISSFRAREAILYFLSTGNIGFLCPSSIERSCFDGFCCVLERSFTVF